MVKNFFDAISNDDLTEFKSLFPDYYLTPFRIKETSQSNLLHLACQLGAQRIVRYLVEEKLANINEPDSEGNVALHYAALISNSDIEVFYPDIAMEISYDTPNTKSSYQDLEPSYTLQIGPAIIKDKIAITEFLLKRPDIILDYRNNDGFSPLRLSSFENTSEEITLLLLKAGALLDTDLNVKQSLKYDYYQNSDLSLNIGLSSDKNPLYWAIDKNFSKLVEYLVMEKKFALNDTNSAIYYALIKQKKDSIACLIACGATININFVETLLEIKKKHNFAEISLNIQDYNGQTPLHIAAKEKNLNIMMMLLASGADPNILDKNGYSPLLFAVKNDSIIMVQTLLNFGADPELSSREKQNILAHGETITNDEQASGNSLSPFHTAITQGSLDIAELFIKYDPVLKNIAGSTLLHYAAFHNYPQAAEFLKEKGQDITVTDSKGKTALDLAKEKGYDKFVEVFSNMRIKIEDCEGKLPSSPVTTPCFNKEASFTRVD